VDQVVLVLSFFDCGRCILFYVGLDLHTRHIAICVLSGTGQLFHRSQVRSIEEMLRIRKGLPDRFEVCYEASCGYGHYYDLLRPLAARVLVAHPGQLRLIFRSKDKNDRKDAERLAKLLYLGETPTVHVPSLEVRTWRELINCRSQVIAKRTRAKNAVQSLLRSAGVVPSKHPGLWTKQGMAWLRPLALPTLSQQLRRDLLLEEIESLVRQGRRIEQQLIHQARQMPAVAGLRSIPGVGLRTAEAVVAFVDDPHRFRHAKAVGSSFGLVPCQDQSGDRNRLGHITRDGAPVVRQLVAEVAWQALRRSPTVRAYFERNQRGDPQRKKIALVATAHYLVRVMWALLKRGTIWEEKLAVAHWPERGLGSLRVIQLAQDREAQRRRWRPERVSDIRSGFRHLRAGDQRAHGRPRDPCEPSSLLPGAVLGNGSTGSISRARAGHRLHPGVRPGAVRRRR
jgi:transposase